MATQSLNGEFSEEKVYVSESFVVDMEHISHHLVEKEINANSRITVSSYSSLLNVFFFHSIFDT